MSRRPGQEAFLGRLASLVSHELRTPLAVIAGYAELLEQRDDEVTRQEAAGRIRQAAGRLSALIDDLVCAAELDAGTLDADAEPLGLRAAIADAVERLAVAKRGCSFTIAGEAGVVVEADANQLRQALVNVLTLASVEGRAVEATVGRIGDFGAVTLVGGAAPPDEEQHAQSLSLSVARRLVELNGGRLTLDDGFRLVLPLERSGGVA